MNDQNATHTFQRRHKVTRGSTKFKERRRNVIGGETSHELWNAYVGKAPRYGLESGRKEKHHRTRYMAF